MGAVWFGSERGDQPLLWLMAGEVCPEVGVAVVAGEGAEGGEGILFDAAADLDAVEVDLVVAEEDEAGVPEDGVAVVGGVVFIPQFLGKEDGVFVLFGTELGELGVSGVLDGGKFCEAFAFPGAGEECFQLGDDIFHGDRGGKEMPYAMRMITRYG